MDVGLMTCFIKSGMLDGVTLSIVMNAGNKMQRVADSSSSSECGIGMFDAESISLCEMGQSRPLRIFEITYPMIN